MSIKRDFRVAVEQSPASDDTHNTARRQRRDLYCEVRQMLLDGKQPYEIKQLLGASSPQISYCRKVLGITPFARGRKTGQSPQTKERANAARVLKQAGRSYSEIARTMNVTRQCVQQYIRPRMNNYGRCEGCGDFAHHLHRHHISYEPEKIILLCAGCHTTQHTRKTVEANKNLITKEFSRQNQTLDEIITLTGLSKATVRKYAKEFGYVFLSKRRRSPLWGVTDWDRPQFEIAREFGISQRCVSSFLLRNQIPHRTRGWNKGKKWRTISDSRDKGAMLLKNYAHIGDVHGQKQAKKVRFVK